MKNINTLELIELFPNLSDDTRELLKGAIATRGKFKGYLLSNAPNVSERPNDWLAWQVLVSNLAPVRCATWSLMFSPHVERFKDLDKEIAPMVNSLNCVEPAFRWNLWASRFDREANLASVSKFLRNLANKI